MRPPLSVQVLHWSPEAARLLTSYESCWNAVNGPAAVVWQTWRKDVVHAGVQRIMSGGRCPGPTGAATQSFVLKCLMRHAASTASAWGAGLGAQIPLGCGGIAACRYYLAGPSGPPQSQQTLIVAPPAPLQSQQLLISSEQALPPAGDLPSGSPVAELRAPAESPAQPTRQRASRGSRMMGFIKVVGACWVARSVGRLLR